MEKLVIDTETTGLSPRFNKTLTVGMLLVDVEKDFLKILKENHIFVKHDNYNISSGAMKVNGIDLVEHDKVAITPPKACNKINDFVDKNGLFQTMIVGHNFCFDRGFLTSLFEQGKMNSNLHDEHEDTRFIWKRLQNQGKIPCDLRARLGDIATYFNIDYTKAHDALADCKITAEVYHRMLGV